LSGRRDTLSDGDHRSWLKTYKREIGTQMERLAATISPSPITVVILWSDSKLRLHLRTMIEELHGNFGELAEIVLVSDMSGSFAGICEEAGIELIQLSLRGLCAGIADHFADEQALDTERAALPTP